MASSVINSEFEDKTRYTLISENKYNKNLNTYIEQILLDKETNKNIRRTLTFHKFVGTPYQIENIRARSILPKFGDAVNDVDSNGINKTTSVKEDTWMEYNPEIMKSNASKKYLAKLLIDKNSDERIKLRCVDGENQENVDKKLKNILNNVNTEFKCGVNNKRINEILNYSTTKQNIQTDNSTQQPKKSVFNLPFDIQKNTSVGKGKFIPPSLKSKISQPTTNNNEKPIYKPRGTYDISKNSQKIRISNIPQDITDDELKNWLRTFNLPNYRLNIIKNRTTQKMRDFAFLNFHNKKYALEAINILNGAKFDYVIINAELSKH